VYFEKADALLTILESKSGNRNRGAGDDKNCEDQLLPIIGWAQCGVCEISHLFGTLILQATIAMFSVACVFAMHSIFKVAVQLQPERSRGVLVRIETAVLDVANNGISLVGFVMVLIAISEVTITINAIVTQCF
jgi:hypothetical protein